MATCWFSSQYVQNILKVPEELSKQKKKKKSLTSSLQSGIFCDVVGSGAVLRSDVKSDVRVQVEDRMGNCHQQKRDWVDPRGELTWSGIWTSLS